MNWLKKLTTNWQYEHNVASTKALVAVVEQLEKINERLDKLEKFAKQSEDYYNIIEARRQSDLDKKGE
jgi:hypothetical protein